MNVKNVHRRSALILTFATLGEFNFINWFFLWHFIVYGWNFLFFLCLKNASPSPYCQKKVSWTHCSFGFLFFCCCCFFFPPPNEKECALSVPCSTKDNRSETVFCRSPTRTWIDHVWSGPFFFFAWVLFTSLFSFHEDEEEEEEEVECRGKGPRMRWKRKRGRKEKEREREREK